MPMTELNRRAMIALDERVNELQTLVKTLKEDLKIQEEMYQVACNQILKEKCLRADVVDVLGKSKDILNEKILYARLGILENDEALTESPKSMCKYLLEQLLDVRKALGGESSDVTAV